MLSFFAEVIGIHFWTLILVFFVVALIDYLLALIPGNKIPEREQDYHLKARLWEYLTYSGGFLGCVIIQTALVKLVPGFEDFISLYPFLRYVLNFGNIATTLVSIIYGKRILGYMRRQSKSKEIDQLKLYQ